MSAAFRTTYTLAEITRIWNAFSTVCDDLADRNGEAFTGYTVDILGHADDAFKIMTGESTEQGGAS